MGDTVVDQLLEEVAAGSDGSKQRLIEAVYQDLRRMAKAQVGRGSGREGTIGATALVHEAWLRLEGDLDSAMRNRAYFYGAAARAMLCRVLRDRLP